MSIVILGVTFGIAAAATVIAAYAAHLHGKKTAQRNAWPTIDPSQAISHKVGAKTTGTVTSFGTYDGPFTPASGIVAYWQKLTRKDAA